MGLSIRPNNIEPGGIQGGNACMDLPRIPPAVVRIFRTRRRGDIPSECLTLPYFSRAVNQPMQSSHTSIYITVALKPCRCHTCHDLTFGDAIFLPSPVLRGSTFSTCWYLEQCGSPTSNNDHGSDTLTIDSVQCRAVSGEKKEVYRA